jgi:hypothetical protein
LHQYNVEGIYSFRREPDAIRCICRFEELFAECEIRKMIELFTDLVLAIGFIAAPLQLFWLWLSPGSDGLRQ